jgi:membrane protein YqaA with SNARE-associated domain
VVLVPLMLARSKQIWRIATVVLIGCIVGALAGYGVGVLVMETVGQRLVEFMGWSEGMSAFEASLEERGFWAILAIGVTPVPFQVAMLGAGATGYPLPLFVLATALARGVRYFGLALCVRLLGERAQRLWDEHATAIGVGILVVAAAAVAWTVLGG